MADLITSEAIARMSMRSVSGILSNEMGSLENVDRKIGERSEDLRQLYASQSILQTNIEALKNKMKELFYAPSE